MNGAQTKSRAHTDLVRYFNVIPVFYLKNNLIQQTSQVNPCQFLQGNDCRNFWQQNEAEWLDWGAQQMQAVDMRQHKKPLYRSVNTRTHGVRHGSGSKSKWERNTKAAAKNQSAQQSMHSGQQHGFDYTPLFKFLLSRVGKSWDEVHSEAVSRLDREEPISWMVAPDLAGGSSFVRLGESSYFSGLYVDDNNILAIVDADLTPESMRPFCACCTHTLNGVRLSTPYSDEAP